MSYEGKHVQRGRHPVLKAVAVSTALVLVVLAGAVFVAYRHLQGNITVSQGFDNVLISRPEEEPVEVEGDPKPLNVLIMGSDSRKNQDAVAGSAPGLSDTTILLHLSADRERAYGVSVPRDLMVPRPQCRSKDGEAVEPAASVDQWNEAFVLGGEACTIAQFEQMAKLRVDHFVVVNFGGFISMVDALGGVPVCVPEEVNDSIGKIHLPKGRYEVTGQQALDYVRVRHDIGTVDTGDLGRLKRQQAFMASMVNKALSAGTMFNPGRLFGFLNAATRSLTTDPEFAKVRELYDLARDVQNIGLDKVQFLSMPFEPYTEDVNRLQPAPGAKQLWRELRMDKPLSPRFTEGAAKASTGKPGTPKKKQNAQQAEAGLCA